MSDESTLLRSILSGGQMDDLYYGFMLHYGYKAKPDTPRPEVAAWVLQVLSRLVEEGLVIVGDWGLDGIDSLSEDPHISAVLFRERVEALKDHEPNLADGIWFHVRTEAFDENFPVFPDK